MELLLIRHGETDWNAERRLQGHLDVPLNPHGRRQAAALAQALRGQPLDALFASDLQRARQTAQAIADMQDVAVQLDAALRERCYGAFEGMLYDDIAGRYPAAHAAWQAREVDARFPAGQWAAETLGEFAERAVTAVTRLAQAAQQSGCRRIALVTHGGVLESVYRAWRGIGHLPARDFEIPNAALNLILHQGHGDPLQPFRIQRWADVAHLQSLPALDEIDA